VSRGAAVGSQVGWKRPGARAARAAALIRLGLDLTAKEDGAVIETFVRRNDAERFVEEIRRDDPDLASYLRIEERARGGWGWTNAAAP
jgi:hypothetical protein